MSGPGSSSRYHNQPASARRHSRDGDYSRHVDEAPAQHSTHRHRHRSSSGRSSPHKHRDPASQEAQRFRPEDYVLEDGVPPLRRQSTQPPRRCPSPTSHSFVAHREVEANVYRRREVEPTSTRRPTTPHQHRSPRDSTLVDPAVSTALVVVEEKQVSPRRQSAHHAARASPRRSHHDSRIETEDGVVRSPRQHVSSTTSPRRAHRQTGSPIRPERRAESSRHRHRHASAELRTRSPYSSAHRHRESLSARRASTPEATHRQDTLRYRSPPLPEESKPRSTSRHARRHSHAADDEPEKKRTTSTSHRRDSAHHGRSSRTTPRHDSERRHRHERHASITASTNDDDDSRLARHASRDRQASQDSSMVPRVPVSGGSTYVRPNGNGHISTRRNSGSYIEVISVNSARPESSSSWLQSPRRPRDAGPPIVIPDPRCEKILERIDSTRHWIKNMKEEVAKDREREQQQQQQQEREAEAEKKRERERERERERRKEEVARQQEAERARREHRRAEERNGSAHRHRSSSRGSQRRTRSSREEANGTAATPVLVEPERTVDSRRHPRPAVTPAAPQEKSRLQSAGDVGRSRARSTHAPSESTRTAPSEKDASSRQSTRPAATPPAPAPAAAAVMHDTINSSRQDGFDYPIFSFVSFLDGNTFDNTAGLCQYNTQLAESLSDEHLDLLREVVFHHDEEAFAELLYGDDVQAEMDVIANKLGHSEDPAVQREIVILQRAAVRRFNEKCSTALRTLLAARGGLADAVQIAASQLERQAYEAGANNANSP